MIFFFFFFFFKQKTAYEMVMSDWSSDVCSSDLARRRQRRGKTRRQGDALEPGARPQPPGRLFDGLRRELEPGGDGAPVEEALEQEAGPAAEVQDPEPPQVDVLADELEDRRPGVLAEIVVLVSGVRGVEIPQASDHLGSPLDRVRAELVPGP